MDFLTVGSCWQVISDGLESIDDSWFEELTDSSVVPNADRILTKPTWLFFRDRPRLSEPFGALLANNVIDRPSGAAGSMIKAGVRLLSTAVEVDLVECEDPVAATNIESVLQDRLPLIRRVLESSALSHLAEDVLAAPSVYWATRLEVIYRVFLGDRYFPSPEARSVSAHLDRSSGHLYVARQTRGWQTVVARELAFAAIPDPSAAHLAAVVEIILGAGDLAEAAVRLDDLGFAPAEVRLEVPVPAPPLDAPDVVSTDELPQEPPEEARQVSTSAEPTTAQRLPAAGIPAPLANRHGPRMGLERGSVGATKEVAWIDGVFPRSCLHCCYRCDAAVGRRTGRTGFVLWAKSGGDRAQCSWDAPRCGGAPRGPVAFRGCCSDVACPTRPAAEGRGARGQRVRRRATSRRSAEAGRGRVGGRCARRWRGPAGCRRRGGCGCRRTPCG